MRSASCRTLSGTGSGWTPTFLRTSGRLSKHGSMSEMDMSFLLRYMPATSVEMEAAYESIVVSARALSCPWRRKNASLNLFSRSIWRDRSASYQSCGRSDTMSRWLLDCS